MISGGYQGYGIAPVKSFTFDDHPVFITLIIVYIPINSGVKPQPSGTGARLHIP